MKPLPNSSNILVGFLNYLKKHPPHSKQKPRHISHAALTLILERGRPITRRVLVTSSPLHQPMDTAQELGYEVRVYIRVPDVGTGQDRRQQQLYTADSSSSSPRRNWRKSSSPASSTHRRHSRRLSENATTTSAESDQGGSTLKRRSLGLGASSNTHTPEMKNQASTSLMNQNHQHAASTPPTGRIRYREQGVDELLQLKLHQAIAEADNPPPDATIVLATGDGNIGQFSDQGFLGPIRVALKKGWKVEIYAWEDGLSKAWKREFGHGPYKDRFMIVGMEKYGADLLEI